MTEFGSASGFSTMAMASERDGSKGSPKGSTCSMPFLAKVSRKSFRHRLTPSDTAAASAASAALSTDFSKLSITGSRPSAKRSKANLCAFSTSRAARRRMFSTSACARSAASFKLATSSSASSSSTCKLTNSASASSSFASKSGVASSSVPGAASPAAGSGSDAASLLGSNASCSASAALFAMVPHLSRCQAHTMGLAAADSSPRFQTDLNLFSGIQFEGKMPSLRGGTSGRGCRGFRERYRPSPVVGIP